MADIITYETLYELLRKEKTSQELQPMDKSFFDKVLNYLKEKQKLLETHEKKDAMVIIDTRMAQKELESIKRMFRELYERRESKILMLATYVSRSRIRENANVMLDQEKQLFTDIVQILDLYRNGVLNNIINLQSPHVAQEEAKSIKTDPQPSPELKTVRFIQPVPQFLDTNLKVYGPFDQLDTANVPKKIADVLIKNARAEEITNENG